MSGRMSEAEMGGWSATLILSGLTLGAAVVGGFFLLLAVVLMLATVFSAFTTGRARESEHIHRLHQFCPYCGEGLR